MLYLQENCAISVDFDFANSKAMEPFSFDYSLVIDEKDCDKLAGFIRGYYIQDFSEWSCDDFEKNNNNYHRMIKEAIKHNNLTAFEILCQGIYYYDRDTPDYVKCLMWGAKYGNLTTFKHTLYKYVNGWGPNGRQTVWLHKVPTELDTSESYMCFVECSLVEQAKKNPDKSILEYALTLETKKDGTLGYEEEYSDEEETTGESLY